MKEQANVSILLAEYFRKNNLIFFKLRQVGKTEIWNAVKLDTSQMVGDMMWAEFHTFTKVWQVAEVTYWISNRASDRKCFIFSAWNLSRAHREPIQSCVEKLQYILLHATSMLPVKGGKKNHSYI